MDFSDELRQTEFVRGIPSSLYPALFALAQARTFSAGTTIFAEGNDNFDFHLVLEGHVRLDMNVAQRGRIPLLTVGPGDVLAWSALLSGGKMTTSARAMEPVRTAAFEGIQLQQLCERESEIGYHVMKQLAGALSRRLLATRLQLLDLFAGHEPVKATNVGTNDSVVSQALVVDAGR